MRLLSCRISRSGVQCVSGCGLDTAAPGQCFRRNFSSSGRCFACILLGVALVPAECPNKTKNKNSKLLAAFI